MTDPDRPEAQPSDPADEPLHARCGGGVDEARAAIRAAPDVDAIVAAAARIRGLPGRLLEEGIGTDAITGHVTALNDLVTIRLIEVTGAGDALAAARGCWFALGSAGRGEQTLATDQDNAIAFADDADPDARRSSLVPAADAVNRALDRCGLPLCRGGVMAGNPRWCLSATEWRRRFAEWIDRPEPEALLNAAIFFDFRPVWGERGIVAGLRSWLSTYAPDRNGFLLLMAQNALGNQPPLGLLRDFVLARGGDHPGTLDLKVNGVQPFVESLRIYALADGVASTSTLERMAGVARVRSVPAAEAEAWREAFRFLQLLRLRLNAAQAVRGEPLHNHLDPDSLNELDRRALKESLRQARKLQARLARDYSLRSGGFGA
jgi:CBS domain-containing protein